MISLRHVRLLVLAILVSGALATSLSAVSNTSGEVDYYSDATFTNQTGLWIKTCTNPGHDIHQGTATAYWRFTADISCGNGGCPSGSLWTEVFNNAPDADPKDCGAQSYQSTPKYHGCIQFASAGCTSSQACSSALAFCAPN